MLKRARNLFFCHIWKVFDHLWHNKQREAKFGPHAFSSPCWITETYKFSSIRNLLSTYPLPCRLVTCFLPFTVRHTTYQRKRDALRQGHFRLSREVIGWRGGLEAEHHAMGSRLVREQRNLEIGIWVGRLAELPHCLAAISWRETSSDHFKFNQYPSVLPVIIARRRISQ